MSHHVSPRQREILWLMFTEPRLTTDGIAARLGISPHTVHSHRQSAYRRLGVQTPLEAFRALGWSAPIGHPGALPA